MVCVVVVDVDVVTVVVVLVSVVVVAVTVVVVVAVVVVVDVAVVVLDDKDVVVVVEVAVEALDDVVVDVVVGVEVVVVVCNMRTRRATLAWLARRRSHGRRHARALAPRMVGAWHTFTRAPRVTLTRQPRLSRTRVTAGSCNASTHLAQGLFHLCQPLRQRGNGAVRVRLVRLRPRCLRAYSERVCVGVA